MDPAALLAAMSGGSDGSLNSLASALATAQSRARAGNPFSPMANAIANVNYGPEKMSRSDSIKTGLLQGLGAGLFSGIGNMYNEAQDASINRGLSALLVGDSLPNDLSPNVFAPVENALKIFDLQQGINQKAATQKLQNEVLLEQFKAGLSGEQDRKTAALSGVINNPYKAKILRETLGDDALKELGLNLGGVTTPTTDVDSVSTVISDTPTKPTTPEVTEAASKVPQTKKETDPIELYDQLMRKTGGNESLTNKLLDRELPNPETVTKELASTKARQDSLDFIDQKFDQAKTLVGAKAGATSFMGIPTTEGQLLSGLGDSLVYQLDKIVGRELNADVRERFLDLAPKWYDSTIAIDKKKQAFKDLLSSLSAATPSLDASGRSEPSPAKTTPKASDLIAQGYRKTARGWER